MHRNRNKFHWLQHGWHLCHNMKNAWLWVYLFIYFALFVFFIFKTKTSGLIKVGLSECKQTTQHWRLTVYKYMHMYNVLIPLNYFSHVISRRVLKIFVICSCIAICYILTLISYSNSDDFYVLLPFSCFISILVSQHSSVDSLCLSSCSAIFSLFLSLLTTPGSEYLK